MSGAASEIIVNTDTESNHQSYVETDKKHILCEDDCPKVKGSYTLYRFSGSINYININVYIYNY